jgi:hypothetical protein
MRMRFGCPLAALAAVATALATGACDSERHSATAASALPAVARQNAATSTQPAPDPATTRSLVQQPPSCQNGPRISWAAEPPANASTGGWIRGRAQVDPTSGFSLVRQWCDETGPNREWTRAQVEALGYAIDTECPPRDVPGTALTRVVAVPQDQVNCERDIIEARTTVTQPPPPTATNTNPSVGCAMPSPVRFVVTPVMCTYTDVDNDAGTWTVSLSETAPAGGSLSATAGGPVTPGTLFSFTYVTTFPGTVATFTITVSDGRGGTGTTSFSVFVL